MVLKTYFKRKETNHKKITAIHLSTIIVVYYNKKIIPGPFLATWVNNNKIFINNSRAVTTNKINNNNCSKIETLDFRIQETIITYIQMNHRCTTILI